MGFESQGPCVSMPSCGNAETARTLGARFASELFNPQRAVQTLSSQNKVGGVVGGDAEIRMDLLWMRLFDIFVATGEVS